MMTKRTFLGFVFATVVCTASAMSTLDSLFVTYDAAVRRSSAYIAQRQHRIDSLKAIRPVTYKLQLQIAHEYQHFQSDSGIVWFSKLTHAPEPYRSKAYIGLVELTTSIGKYDDAISVLPELNDVPDNLRVDCAEAIWRLYTEGAARHGLPQLRAQWQQMAKVQYDSLLNEMERRAPFSTDVRLRYEILQAIDAKDPTLALAINDTILSRLPAGSHRIAIESYTRSTLYEMLGQDRKRIEWLIRSAIVDVQCGITDNGSSWLVAKECFESGDLERAYRYSDYSLTNASFFNAPTRFIETYVLGHEIASEYEHRLRRYSVGMTIAVAGSGLMLIALIIGVAYSLRQNRRLHNLYKEIAAKNEELHAFNRQLKEADKVKEQYICRYLEVYNDYIRRLTTMARRAGEKDPAAFMDREMENFYRSFDDTFLSLYGTFVEDFNALLKPEARIQPKPGERMTIEMRIFALILLGITSSTKIAELLCYSPNTISNYRVKMKNGAIGDRDTFEQQVQQIGNHMGK